MSSDFQHPDLPIKAMIITMGGPRREALEELLSNHRNSIEPTFVPGVPSRALRTRSSFASYCHQAGLLPQAEWEAVKDGCTSWEDALAEIPPPQPGAPHYLLELWHKGKALNRGRAVLACTLAHLIALRRFTQDGTFDLILEDNVRWNPNKFVQRIRDIQMARKRFELEHNETVHMQYFGWLASMPNLRWTYSSHIPKRGYAGTIVAFPDPQDISGDLSSGSYVAPLSGNEGDRDCRQPGGNPVWGSYGYWMSVEGYNSVMSVLRQDVGSMLWKGKRQRCYQVKPVDKLLPRLVRRAHGYESVQLCVKPVFFRAPMLTSKIHTQYDPEFCKSTTLQLELSVGEQWSSIALSGTEQAVVSHWEKSGGNWLSPAEF